MKPKEQKTGNYKSFHYLENGDIIYSNYSTVKVSNKLLPGTYTVEWDYRNERIILKQHTDEEIIDNCSFKEKEVLDKLFKTFLDEKVKEKIKKLNFLHKVGVLLYGKEGTGKTSILKKYYHSFIKEKEGIVFILPSDSSYIEKIWGFVRGIRFIQDNLITVLFDEVDSLLKESYGESKMKQILDGNLSIDNCIFLAATNYIDKIPKAVKRNSRFKYVLEVEKIEDKTHIKNIINSIIGDDISHEKLEELSEKLKKSTLDEIKHACLDEIMDITHHLERKESKIGF